MNAVVEAEEEEVNVGIRNVSAVNVNEPKDPAALCWQNAIYMKSVMSFCLDHLEAGVVLGGEKVLRTGPTMVVVVVVAVVAEDRLSSRRRTYIERRKDSDRQQEDPGAGRPNIMTRRQIVWTAAPVEDR